MQKSNQEYQENQVNPQGLRNIQIYIRMRAPRYNKGLKFATRDDAVKSVNKIRNSGDQKHTRYKLLSLWNKEPELWVKKMLLAFIENI